MTLAERYKNAAARLRAKARSEESPQIKERLESLAQGYVSLAVRLQPKSSIDTVQNNVIMLRN